MALAGAELLFYPTAIGSEPILEVDSAPHWQRCMQGHAAANLMPVIAANRIGTEHITPDEENQQQTSSLSFYGTSFSDGLHRRCDAAAGTGRSRHCYADIRLGRAGRNAYELGRIPRQKAGILPCDQQPTVAAIVLPK